MKPQATIDQLVVMKCTIDTNETGMLFTYLSSTSWILVPYYVYVN